MWNVNILFNSGAAFDLKYIQSRGCKYTNVRGKSIEHKKLPILILKYDIYLQPSIVTKDGAEENLSVATIEAQAMGLPSIVSNIGGLKEIIVNEKTDYLVDDKSVEAILNKIQFYIHNEEILKEHSINSSLLSLEKFNGETIIKKWINVYLGVKNDI